MKKLAVMAMMMLMAGLGEAATVRWNSGQIIGPTDVLIGNTGAYLAVITFYTDAGGTTPFDAGSGTQISDDTSSLSAFAGTTANNFATGASSLYAQMVITSDDGLWIRESQIRQLGTIPTLGDHTLNLGSGAGFLGGTVGGSLWADTEWQPIPEPTTWALLLVGAAAIGLRRRLKK